jgi:energy-coupling factor transporter ATP-binding protein EcfA2
MPSVAKELAYPLENRGISSDEVGQRVTEYSRMFALEDILEKGPDELSGGQITSLAIASALITDPSVIILDEPDSHFDKTRETTLLDFIDTYRGRKTIILITQYLQYASKAVRVAIMKEGAVVKQGLPDEILGDETLLVRANLIPDQKALKVAKAPARHMESKSLITLESINYSYPGQAVALTDLSFEIRAGQKVGIYGEIGSGKTTLGLIMSGLILPQSGHVSLKGKPIDQYDENSLRQVITMSMQFPERAMFEQSVADDIACGPKNLGKNDVETLVERQIGKFQLDNLRDRHLFTLSGGEKRKAALAGILAMDTEIVILDEPTAALDPRSCRDLAEIIWDSNDMTFIIISHDRDFLKTTCNRFIEMHQGEIKSDKDIL